VDPVLMRDRVIDIVRDAIISGKLKSGQRVRERELISLLGISRSPLREALRTLASEGFLTSIPNRGVWVSEISAADLHELVEVRIMVETYSARLFMEKGNDRILRELENQVHQSLTVGPDVNRADNFDIALHFHDLLVAAGGNHTLIRFHETFKQHQRRYQYFAFDRIGHDRHAMQEHADLLDALIKKDLPRLENLLRSHLWRFYEEVKTMFDKDPKK
jgi:DNA-binding GntR family transcriptional regulator